MRNCNLNSVFHTVQNMNLSQIQNQSLKADTFKVICIDFNENIIHYFICKLLGILNTNRKNRLNFQININN